MAAAASGFQNPAQFANQRRDNLTDGDSIVTTGVQVEFQRRLDAVAADIEDLLALLLGSQPQADEHDRPRRLMDAMRYASLGGGKRLRPFLVVESAALFGVPRARALRRRTRRSTRRPRSSLAMGC